ncbi:MAG: BCAM0308 family protein [Nitrospirota bacterium]
MSTHSKIPAGLAAHREQTYQEEEHDTYKLRGKLKEPTLCPTCGAVFHKGRWTWDTKPADTHETLCPACRRIHDKYPKGVVTIKGPCKDTQHEQLIGVVNNPEEKEKKNTRLLESWPLNHNPRACSFPRPIPICHGESAMRRNMPITGS